MNDTDGALAAAPAPTPDPPSCPICKKLHTGSDASTLRRLAESPARLKQLVRGLDRSGLGRSYGAGKWTIREIVCHLRDCEIVFGIRWRLMLSEEAPPIPAFDQDHWAAETRYVKQDCARALATLVELRAANLELLKVAGKAALCRVGNHPEYGPLTIADMARHILAHDVNHLAQVATARAMSVNPRTKRSAPHRQRR